MPRRRSLAESLALLVLALAMPPTAPAADPAPAPSPDQVAFFEKEVRPLLVEACAKCHGAEKQKGGLRVDSLRALLDGGDSGPALVPGQPEESLLIEAVRHNVLPMDDRAAERMNPAIAGRPGLVMGSSLRLYPGMTRLNENVALDTKNRSYQVTAEISVPEDGADGAIVVQGGRTGGWGLVATEGKLAYHYNFCGLVSTTVTSDAALPAGTHQVRAEFAYDGGGYGKGGSLTLTVDGEQIGEGRIERTVPFQFSFDETVDVGCDLASPVSPDYEATGNGFTGDLIKLRIDLGDDDHSHLIDPEHRLQVAMMQQ